MRTEGCLTKNRKSGLKTAVALLSDEPHRKKLVLTGRERTDLKAALMWMRFVADGQRKERGINGV